ncbi:MAG: hypothetical protein GXO90_06710 [FCB group bacterium]|nr:hypothetical protein [FCB group bacterium]
MITNDKQTYMALAPPVFLNKDTLSFLTVNNQYEIQKMFLRTNEVATIGFNKIYNRLAVSDFSMPILGWILWVNLGRSSVFEFYEIIGSTGVLLLNTILSSGGKGHIVYSASDYQKLKYGRQLGLAMSFNAIKTNSANRDLLYQTQYSDYLDVWNITLRSRRALSWATSSFSVSRGKSWFKESSSYYSDSIKKELTYFTVKAMTEYDVWTQNRFRSTIGMGIWGYFASGSTVPEYDHSHFKALVEMGVHFRVSPTITIGGLYPITLSEEDRYNQQFQPTPAIQVIWNPGAIFPDYESELGQTPKFFLFYSDRIVNKDLYNEQDDTYIHISEKVPVWGFQIHTTISDQLVLILQFRQSYTYSNEYLDVSSNRVRKTVVSAEALKYNYKLKPIQLGSFAFTPGVIAGAGFGNAYSSDFTIPVGISVDYSSSNYFSTCLQMEADIMELMESTGEATGNDFAFTFGIGFPIGSVWR